MELKKDKNIEISTRNNVFYGSDNLFFVHKKSIKISKALYLITDIIKDTEPLKQSIRQAGVDLINIKDTSNIERFLRIFGGQIESIKSLIELGIFTRNISQMNGEIITRECDLLINLLDGYTENFSRDVVPLDKHFFAVEVEKTPSPFSVLMHTEKQNEGMSFKGQLKDSGSSVRHLVQKGSGEGVKNDKPDSQGQVTVFQKSDRKDKIMDIIKKKEEVTIKDISSLITDCSEKTIQRELNDLLNQGLLKKTGERRWSKYSLL